MMPARVLVLGSQQTPIWNLRKVREMLAKIWWSLSLASVSPMEGVGSLPSSACLSVLSLSPRCERGSRKRSDGT